MPTLRELQSMVGKAILGHPDADAAALVHSDGCSPAACLGIHGNTSAAVLVNALRLAHPAVERLVGAAFFEAAARCFAAASPPHSAWLDEYGGTFADFLAAFPPAAALSYLADVARLDWLVHRALHAPDAAPLDLGSLAGLDVQVQDDVRLEPHPALGLLATACPADAIWHAVLTADEAALASVDPAAGSTWLLVERRPSGVELRRLSEPAWRFVAALCAGEPIGRAAAGVTGAAPLLAEHLASGRFIGICGGPRVATRQGAW